MSDKPTPMACPDCKLMSFTVWRDSKKETVTVKCEGCDRILLVSQPTD